MGASSPASPRDVDPTDHDDAGAVHTFRPGTILAREGDRIGCRFEILAGIVEESLGIHLVGRHSRGTIVPRGASGRSEVTCRAVTVVRAREVTAT